MNEYFIKLNKFPKNETIINMKEYAKSFNVPIINDEGLSVLLLSVLLTKAKRILEIGTAIGYSAINMALMDEMIIIDTIERDSKMVELARKNIRDANLEKQINVFEADALLLDNKVLKEEYDLIFIDAAKAQYQKFFEKYSCILSPKGIIFSDNLLFHGLVNNHQDIKSKNLKNMVTKIEMFNDFLSSNLEYDTIFLPIGDGISISMRKKNE